MKINTIIALSFIAVASNAFAQADVRTNKVDVNNCPMISVSSSPNAKPFRLTVNYTHSGTTLGRRSSHSDFIEYGNFRAGESRDFPIHPGANCGAQNRLVIDSVIAAPY